jgi:outer membrane protein assembly factor BamE (lipoprotein component of BamABCDE complex)
MKLCSIIILSVHRILFRSAAASCPSGKAARWLCVTDRSIRLLQTHSAACAARLLNNCERLLIILLLCTTVNAADLWESPQAWQELHRKMTESQVADLLGNPKETETVGHNLVWYYQDVPRQNDGQIIWRPKAAFVHFKQIAINGESIFMLYGWKPPHIEKTPPPPPPAEDIISPNNPLAQLEQIEKVYMEQLQLADPENFSAPTQSSPQRQSPKPPAAPGLPLSQLFNKLPRQWVLVGIGGICFVTALAILWPRKRRHSPKYKEEIPLKPKKREEVEL